MQAMKNIVYFDSSIVNNNEQGVFIGFDIFITKEHVKCTHIS